MAGLAGIFILIGDGGDHGVTIPVTAMVFIMATTGVIIMDIVVVQQQVIMQAGEVFTTTFTVIVLQEWFVRELRDRQEI